LFNLYTSKYNSDHWQYSPVERT